MTPQRISKSHLPALDGLRGIALILVVLLAHYGQLLDGPEPFLSTALSLCSYVGLTGVDLFFVLSGFLITGILLDTRDSPSYFRAFYARRVLRIFPLYYAFLFLELVPIRGLHRLLEKSDRFAGVEPAWYLAYLSNLGPGRGVHDFALGHMWSLAVEEQFYLVWPLVLFLVPRRFLVPLYLAGIAAATLIRFRMALQGHWEEDLHRFTPGRMDTLLLGALAAVAFRDDAQKALWSRSIRPVAFASGLVFAAVVAATVYLRPPFSIYFTLGSGAIATFYACLVFGAATSAQGHPLLCLAPLRMLGKYSYGIYVLHVPFFFYIRDGMSRATIGDRLLNLAVNLAATAVLAYISWVALGRPALSLKRYFEYDPPRPAGSTEVAPPSVVRGKSARPRVPQPA